MLEFQSDIAWFKECPLDDFSSLNVTFHSLMAHTFEDDMIRRTPCCFKYSTYNEQL